MGLSAPIGWLKDFVDIDLSPEALAERLTLAGLEVEAVTPVGQDWDPQTMRVCEVLEVARHPEADRLSVVRVGLGGGSEATVVTGAPNIGEAAPAADGATRRAALAMVGASVPDAHSADGKRVRLKPAVLRGVRSDGMLCSERELGLSDNHDGVLILPGDAPAGAPLRSYLADHVVHFDIKGGFSHLMSMVGVAREVAALTGRPLRRAALEAHARRGLAVRTATDYLGVAIEAPEKCSRFTGLLVRGVKVGPSPFWIQQRLRLAGMRPINNIVDVTNYVMLELGQPLHAFDYDKLAARAEKGAPRIAVRAARPGETIRTLDGARRALDEQMLLIADDEGPLAIAGVMGGEETEVDSGTTNVLLEAANFEFLNIRRTSQVLKLRTEASDRFGKRIDPNLTLAAAARAAELMEGFGGAPDAAACDLYPAPRGEAVVAFDPAHAARLLGVDIGPDEVAAILESLEFRVERGATWTVAAPSHRMDVAIPADLVEEVARVYGYDRMKPTRMADELPPQRANRNVEAAETVRDLLCGLGLDEVITYSIIDPNDEAKFAPGTEPDLDQYVPLRNPLAKERSHMRRRLLPSGLQCLAANLKSRKRAALYELGAVFHPRQGRVLPDETRRLMVAMSGERRQPSWHGGGGEAMDFYDLKGVVEGLLEGLRIQGANFRKASAPPFHPGRCAEVFVQGHSLGLMGELHPRVANAFGMPGRAVCALEFDLDPLVRAWTRDNPMAEVSPFEPVYEDMAFVVDDSVPSDLVGSLILRVGKPLLRGVELFDVYKGDRVAAGRKSLAYALTYQAVDRSLGDEQVAPVRRKIVERLKRELNADLRG